MAGCQRKFQAYQSRPPLTNKLLAYLHYITHLRRMYSSL